MVQTFPLCNLTYGVQLSRNQLAMPTIFGKHIIISQISSNCLFHNPNVTVMHM